MHFSGVGILAINLFSCLTPALVISSPSSIDGQRLPDQWFAYYLDNSTDLSIPTSDGNSTALVAREQVKVCERILSAVASCFGIAGVTYTLAEGFAGIIKGRSESKTCASVSGSIAGYDYMYYATGKDCDTTATQETIAGALYHYLTTVEDDKVCGTQCLKLDHSGTWDGFLKFGKSSVFDSSAYCGNKLSYYSCASGGKKDL
ncbi:hypothetical protein BO71DRAFT_478514 [Aspergillus ellipticus CBS 707.79]|uniref:Secreted protein CSS2 C-terminal domain-containing protein n=1 Tax=Aspergillus ellipticus CBS 707.79 TaxID=1448320 RepID=A0A319D7F2_9EURO|nr:hypothetical protein BO71DRAFT_478514 [Aspergillus ellipticus CBS 707.79]